MKTFHPILYLLSLAPHRPPPPPPPPQKQRRRCRGSRGTSISVTEELVMLRDSSEWCQHDLCLAEPSKDPVIHG